MQATLGPIARKMDANVRIVRGSALIPGSVNTSTQIDKYVKLPTAANGVFAGLAADDTFEPGFNYTAGTDPSTINGVAPGAPYDLSKQPISVILLGVFQNALASAAVADGAFVKIADTTGRLVAVGGEGAGVVVNAI